MEEIEGLIQQVSKVKDGFKPIQAEAENILVQHTTYDSLQLAHRLYTSNKKIAYTYNLASKFLHK